MAHHEETEKEWPGIIGVWPGEWNVTKVKEKRQCDQQLPKTDSTGGSNWKHWQPWRAKQHRNYIELVSPLTEQIKYNHHW